MSLRSDGYHLLMLRLGCRLRLENNNRLGIGTLLLSDENRLCLALYEGCLWLCKHIVLTRHTARYHIMGLPTRSLLHLQYLRLRLSLSLSLLNLWRRGLSALHRRYRDDLIVRLKCLLDNNLSRSSDQQALLQLLLELLLGYRNLMVLHLRLRLSLLLLLDLPLLLI